MKRTIKMFINPLIKRNPTDKILDKIYLLLTKILSTLQAAHSLPSNSLLNCIDDEKENDKRWNSKVLLRLKMLLALNVECLIALFGSLKAKKNTSSYRCWPKSIKQKREKITRQWASLWIYKGTTSKRRRKFSRWNSTSDEGRGNLSINMTKALSLMSYSKQ